MIGQRLARRYQLLEELGRGGMGVVYRAFDPQLVREVAVKMVVAGADPISEQRFRREAQRVAQLDHPAIVPVFDFGRHENALFFVMPVLRGMTLDQLMGRSQLSLEAMLEIVCQVADALDYSAEHGVIHRDVKPENIMVEASAGGRPRVWVMDFGLAIGLRESRLTKTGQLPGTLVYLSPEYILTQEVDGRSDLYSLGTILYEYLGGEPPFASSNRGALLFRIVHETPAPLTDRGVDRELSRLVSLCLAKEPDQRPQRGGDMAAALRSWLARHGTGTGAPAVDQPLDPWSTGAAEAPQTASLYGRDDERRWLIRHLRAADEVGQWVLLGGRVGIGKSRLLDTLAHEARKRGRWVLRGRYSRRRRNIPWHALGELVQDAFRQLDDDDPVEPSSWLDVAPGLLRHVPMLDEIAPLRRAAEQAARNSDYLPMAEEPTVFDLVRRTLLRLTGSRPLVVLLEDVQWATAAERALHGWIQDLLAAPTLVVTTYCSETLALAAEADDLAPLHGLLRAFDEGQWADRASCVQGTLGPLPRGAHARLLNELLAATYGPRLGRLTTSVSDELYVWCEGNPRLAGLVVPSLVSSGCLAIDDGGTWRWHRRHLMAWTVPDDLTPWVERRCHPLNQGARRDLAMASVLGEWLHRRHLEDLLGDGAGARVEVLLHHGVLQMDPSAQDAPRGAGAEPFLGSAPADPSAPLLRFRSPLLRQALYVNLPRRRRRVLHRRIADQLQRRHGDDLQSVHGLLAEHFAGADMALEAATFGLLWARHMAETGRPDQVVKAARTALDALRDERLDDDAEVEGELRHVLARALHDEGQSDAALAQLESAAKVLEASAALGAAAQVAVTACGIAWQRRRLPQTRRWLSRGLAWAQDAASQAALRPLLTLQGTILHLQGDDVHGASALRRAAAVGSQSTASGSPEIREPVEALTIVELMPPEERRSTAAGALVFETLTRVAPGGHIVGGLAEKFQLEDSGRRLRLNLRPDARWHDGRGFEANDVKRCFETLLRSSGGALPLDVLRGSEAFRRGDSDDIEGLHVLSKHQLMLVLQTPAPRFPAGLSHPRLAMVSPGPSAPVVGTGRFAVAEASPDGWVLEPFAGHPDHAAGARCRRVIRWDVEATAAASGLRRGDYDVVANLSWPEARFLGGTAEIRQHVAPTFSTVTAVLADDGPLTDTARRDDLRRILRRWVADLDPLGPCAAPATSLLAAGLAGHRPRSLSSANPRRSRSERATSDLWVDDDLRCVVAPELAIAYSSELDQLQQVAAQQGVVLRLLTPRGDTAASAEEIWDLLLLRCDMPFPDSDAVVSSLLSRSARLGWQGHETLDDLIASARQLVDGPTRHQAYRRIDELLQERHGVVPLFEEQRRYGVRADLDGWRTSPGWPRVAYDSLRRKS